MHNLIICVSISGCPLLFTIIYVPSTTVQLCKNRYRSPQYFSAYTINVHITGTFIAAHTRVSLSLLQSHLCSVTQCGQRSFFRTVSKLSYCSSGCLLTLDRGTAISTATTSNLLCFTSQSRALLSATLLWQLGFSV